MAVYTNCPICYSEKISEHMVCNDHFVSGESFALYKCAVCETCFTQDHPHESEMTRYYSSEEYISHSDTSKGISNKLYKLARSFMLMKKTELVRQQTGLKKGALLDVGCGTGYFAAAMKKAGWQVTGIETDERARASAVSKFNLKVFTPAQIDFIPSQSYDCITLWHVLEHFHDPYIYFPRIMSLLKPGGSCIVALPNNNSYDAIHYGKYWAAYDVPRHIWHFNPSSFGHFLQKAGFECKGIKNMPFDAFYISALSEKYKGNRFSFVTGMIKGKIFFLKSMFNVKKSSSLIYLLRK